MCNGRIFADVIVLHLSSLAYDLTHKNRGKNVHATIPKVNMGYDQYTVPVTLAVKTSCFPLACANIRSLPLMPFFQISLKNGELKTTHNTFRIYQCHKIMISIC